MQYLSPAGFDSQNNCYMFTATILGYGVKACLRGPHELTSLKVIMGLLNVELVTTAFLPSNPGIEWFPLDASCSGVTPHPGWPPLPFQELVSIGDRFAKLGAELKKSDNVNNLIYAFWNAFLR